MSLKICLLGDILSHARTVHQYISTADGTALGANVAGDDHKPLLLSPNILTSMQHPKCWYMLVNQDANDT